VSSIVRRLRLRLLPALVTALGVALLASGLLSFTTAVESPPSARPYATYDPPPSFDGTIVLPDASEPVTVEPTFPPDRVATRIVIRRLDIDLPIILQIDEHGLFPLCDVALYIPQLGQPGSGRATYLYAHARAGMFLPLLTASQKNDGRRMLGMTVEVYTSDNWRYLYFITEVRRHTLSLEDAFKVTTEQVWMQTSEGPIGTVPKLQVVAEFLTAEPTDPASAHPKPHPRVCS
jgi:hypothetical protein